MVRMISPSPVTWMNAFGSNASAFFASLVPSSRLRLRIRAPPAAAPTSKNPRLEKPFAAGGSPRPVAQDLLWSTTMVSLPLSCRGLLDRFANAHIGPAAADVAGHCVIDIVIGRLRFACEQRRRRHDLARLAVPAL